MTVVLHTILLLVCIFLHIFLKVLTRLSISQGAAHHTPALLTRCCWCCDIVWGLLFVLSVKVLLEKRTVILPKIISWYSDDFNCKDEESNANGSTSSSLACLLQVKRHFTG